MNERANVSAFSSLLLYAFSTFRHDYRSIVSLLAMFPSIKAWAWGEVSHGINRPKDLASLCSIEICWHSVTSYTHAPLHTGRSSHVSDLRPVLRGRFQSGYQTRLACHSGLTRSLFLGCFLFIVFSTLVLPLDHLPTVMLTVCNSMPLLTFIIYSDAEH